MGRDSASFLDTNILLYESDNRDSAKQAIARELIRSQDIVISVQVLMEFYSGSVGKFKMPPAEARTRIDLLSRGKVVKPDAEMVLRAIDTSERNQISFWDSMIIEAAVAGKCSVVLTEDMNHGQTIRGVKIVNPFR